VRKLLGFGLLIALVVFVVVASGNSDDKQTATVTSTSSTSSSSPGASSVYEEITAESDCTRLQAMFDTASANHDRESESNNLTLMRVASSYMSAVYDRQNELGCF
jgi:hypothetical protein